MTISPAQIELATDFLISSTGHDATALADEEFRAAFRNGELELAEYWRSVRERASERLAAANTEEEFSEPATPSSEGANSSNVIVVNFAAA